MLEEYLFKEIENFFPKHEHKALIKQRENGQYYAVVRVDFEKYWYKTSNYFENDESLADYFKPDRYFGVEYTFKQLNCLELFLYRCRWQSWRHDDNIINFSAEKNSKENHCILFTLLIKQFPPKQCWEILFKHLKCSYPGTKYLIDFTKILINECYLEDRIQNNKSLFDFFILIVYKGFKEPIHYLMQHYSARIDVNATFRKSDGMLINALSTAIDENHGDCIRPLVTFGVKVNALLPSGVTPLSFALRRDHTSALKALLENKADSNQLCPERKGSTLLHDSYKQGNSFAFKLLLSHGAAYDVPDDKGKTVLNLAADTYISSKNRDFAHDYYFLVMILEKDNGRIFNRFKEIYSDNPGFSLFATTMRNHIARGTIQDMRGVLRYLIQKNNTKSWKALDILAKELSIPYSNKNQLRTVKNH